MSSTTEKKVMPIKETPEEAPASEQPKPKQLTDLNKEELIAEYQKLAQQALELKQAVEQLKNTIVSQAVQISNPNIKQG